MPTDEDRADAVRDARLIVNALLEDGATPGQWKAAQTLALNSLNRHYRAGRVAGVEDAAKVCDDRAKWCRDSAAHSECMREEHFTFLDKAEAHKEDAAKIRDLAEPERGMGEEE